MNQNSLMSIFHSLHCNAFLMGHKKPRKEMEKQMCFNGDEEKTFRLLTKDIRDRTMETNVFLKAFCAAERNKANTKK